MSGRNAQLVLHENAGAGKVDVRAQAAEYYAFDVGRLQACILNGDFSSLDTEVGCGDTSSTQRRSLIPVL